MREIKNLIGGERITPETGKWREIIDPADGRTVVARFRESGADVAMQAVKSAAEAFHGWAATPVVKRCRILFHCKELMENRIDELSEAIVKENGKLFAEAKGSVRRGIEVLEFACGMPQLLKGEWLSDISENIDGWQYREPLGVVAGACPFNFPAMVPMWMFPVAIACGNTFVLKPSDKCPISADMIADIFHEAGLPPGVLNVVHGGRDAFEAMIDAPEVKAVSFVGSTPVARAVWQSATAAGKRCQSLGGAKNYNIIMPDASPQKTVDALIGSAFGCAGERCMATSVAVIVKGAEPILEQMIDQIKAIKLGNGMDAETGMGPVISAEHRDRILKYIDTGINEGAELSVDGRNPEIPEGCEDGFFVGPVVFDKVTPEMGIAKEEIFGPVLSVMRAESLNKAIELANKSCFGNGASIFTGSGGAAREFRTRIECGMVGINAGVPAPMAFFSFGGYKASLFGDLKMHGRDGVEFYTKKKAIIQRWFDGGETGNIWGH